MLEQHINLWDTPSTAVRAVTTNGITFLNDKDEWELVMGAGNAKQAKLLYPDLPTILGKWVKNIGNYPLYVKEHKIISFPTKYNWRSNSTLKLIEDSALLLIKIIRDEELEKVYLPRPGASLGGLDYEKVVRPLLEDLLPDNVVVIHWP